MVVLLREPRMRPRLFKYLIRLPGVEGISEDIMHCHGVFCFGKAGREVPQKKKWEEQVPKEERDRRKRMREKQLAQLVTGQPMYNDGHHLAFMMAQYVAAQHEADEPLTAAGCAIACNCVRNTIWKYGTGDFDHWSLDVEDRYRDKLEGEALFIYDYLIGGEHEGKKVINLSDVVAHYNEIATAEREKRLYKRGSVADIFALKAQDGWQDDSGKATTNNTLVITGGESAEAALKLLGYTKSE